MKKCMFSMVAALIVLCCATLFASAAESDPDITVQLNGQNLEFTDAAPQIQDGRVFLPYRAVFEAMGAEVDSTGNVVTAARGDTVLSMTIGETTATVTRGDVIETLTMDVAPYVDTETWRTYVPVRFAADAFGCSVGWDQAAMTAIIVDVDTLVDAALAGKEFTVLEQYEEYSQKFNTGNWAVSGTMDASASMLTSGDLPLLTGSLDGIVAGNSAGEMSLTMDMDMSALMSYLATLQGVTLADMGVTEDSLRMSMAMDMKVDAAAGICYMQMDDALNTALNIPAGTWLSMDLNELLAQSGMDYSTLVAQSQNMDMVDLLKMLLVSIPLDDRAADGYTTLSETLDTVLAALSDEGFQKTDDGYTTTLPMAMEGIQLTLTLDLTADDAGQINGYGMDLSAQVQLDEDTQAFLMSLGIPVSQISMNLSASMDENNQMQSVISISAPNLFEMDMTVDLSYSVSDTAPDTDLPEGATVVDYMELLAGVAIPQA